ncbi:MAG: adenylate/guanylate cyclase domain-containing protein [Hyphomonadaceae bacterium]
MTAADETRKLTTILAIDVVGYSAAAERDQVEAARRITRLRARISELAAAHGGRVFNTAGDGFMLEFPLASAAVRAAIALLEDVTKPDSDLPRIRAGAHLGEVMIDNDDLLGHGVNVASRLVAQAEPNALVISEAVKAQLHGEIDARFTPLGSVQLAKMRESVFAHGYAPGAANADWRQRLVRIAKRRWRRIAAGAALAVAAIAAAGVLVTQPVSYVLEPMQLVAYSSRPEAMPALSPDARFVVYAVQQGEQFWDRSDLFLRSVAGGEETQLTDTADFNEGMPAFSPTGDRLAYARWNRREFLENGYTYCQIMVREFPSGLDRQVGGCQGNGPNRLAWTGDGSGIVFSDTADSEGLMRLRVLDLATGNVRDLAAPIATGMGDMAARVSPDGERVAFVRYLTTESADVYVYDLRRRRMTRITEDESWAQVAWADSSNLFVVKRTNFGSTELWLHSANGHGAGQRLLPGLAHLSRPETAAGVLAVQVETRAVNLWRSRGGRTNAITEGNQQDSAADFSSNGVLAFARGLVDDWLYLQPPGEQPRRLVQTIGVAPDDLRWLPDGRRLAYTATHEGRSRLFLVDVASGIIQEVELEGDAEIGNPTFAPDGRSVVFARLEPEGPRLYRLDLRAGAQPQPISDHGWFTAIETPEGLFAVHRVQNGIWRLDPERGPVLVFPDFRPYRDNALLHWERDWTVSGGNIYVVDKTQRGRVRVLSRAISGGPVRRVLDTDGTFAGSLAVDPVSGDIVFGVAVESSYDIAVIPFSRR